LSEDAADFRTIFIFVFSYILVWEVMGGALILVMIPISGTLDEALHKLADFICKETILNAAVSLTISFILVMWRRRVRTGGSGCRKKSS